MKSVIVEYVELMKKFFEMEYVDVNMVYVKFGKSGEIVWQFIKVGEFQFVCLQLGYFEVGMVGKLIVK